MTTQLVYKKRYKVINDIAAGKSSKVYEAKDKTTKNIVAIKVFNPTFVKESKGLINEEITVLKSVKHSNILKLYDCSTDDESCFLVLERCKRSVLDLVESSRHLLPQPLVRTIIQQTLKGLQHLHAAGWIHNDIKLSNILVSNDNTIKVADFGFSTKIERAKTGLLSLNGSPEFVPPEAFIGKGYNEKFDIWSVGILCFVLLAKKYPLRVEEDDIDKFRKSLLLVREKGGFDWKYIERQYPISGCQVSCLKRLLDPVVSKRPSAKESLTLDWLKPSKKSFRRFVKRYIQNNNSS